MSTGPINTSTKMKSRVVDRLKILRRVRRYLEVGQHFYICTSIVHHGNALSLYDAQDDLVTYVRKSIEPHITYDAWLYCNHMDVHYAAYHRELRIAWVDRMINKLEHGYELD